MIGAPEVIDALAAIAPLVAIRGNNDRAAWASRLPATATVDLGGIRLYMLHDLKELDHDPRAAGCVVVVAGHSHKPTITERNGVLFINPGSAGPRRFKLPVAVARLHVDDAVVRGESIVLDV